MLLTPINNTPESILTQYVVFTTLGILAHVSFHFLHKKFFYEIPSIFEDSEYFPLLLTSIVIAPISEEILFRGVPLYLYPNGELFPLAVATFAWILLHGRRGAVFAATGGLFFVKLWLVGLPYLAIAIHAFHNGWVFTVHRSIQQFKDGYTIGRTQNPPQKQNALDETPIEQSTSNDKLKTTDK